MTQRIEQLCGDPLFQLNLSIWLAQPIPMSFSIRPIFYESGFNIYSVGLLLALPPDIRLDIEKYTIDCQDGAKPDLILATDSRDKLCILECKRASFGSNSSTAKQSRTLMLLSGPIVSEIMAIGQQVSSQGILIYLTKADQTMDLQNTLEELSQEISVTKLKTGEYGCLGIKSNEKSILIEYSDKLKTLMNFNAVSPVKIISIENDTDPRPLYFIPYDPAVFNEQSEEEEKFCKRILFERFLSHILSKIGSSSIPSEVLFTREEILNGVTFGLYSMWDDNDAKRYIKKVLRFFMDSLVMSLDQNLKKLTKHDSQRGWIFKLDIQSDHKEMMKQLSKFKPESMDLGQKIEPELELFDD